MAKTVDTPHGPARVHLRQVESPRTALVLGHGAGGGVESPDLVGATEVAFHHGEDADFDRELQIERRVRAYASPARATV